MDNQEIKLLRALGCTVKDDSREIGILMRKLSDILGRVDIPTIEAQPEMLKAYHIVKEKADAVAMERSIPDGKKRTVYLPEYKTSLELLLTKDGLIILRNALGAGALAAALAAAPVAAAAPVTAALSNQENEAFGPEVQGVAHALEDVPPGVFAGFNFMNNSLEDGSVTTESTSSWSIDTEDTILVNMAQLDNEDTILENKAELDDILAAVDTV